MDLRSALVSAVALLKKHRTLASWLAWGILLSLWSHFVLRDSGIPSAAFMGLAALLGLTLQFARAKWLRRDCAPVLADRCRDRLGTRLLDYERRPANARLDRSERRYHPRRPARRGVSGA